MGLNDVASAERLHIGFFGMRNAGKSSVVNAVTGQELSVVSEVKGTTTDPVKKAMELLPLGPVVIVDTPGIDDEGALGEMRVKKAKQALDFTDIAVLVVDATKGLVSEDKELIKAFEDKKIPYIVTHNKADLLQNVPVSTENSIFVSAVTGLNINELKEMLGKFAAKNDKKIVADLLNKGDIAVLVVPIDSAAPKGRLIMPQQLTIRDILDGGGVAVVCQETELTTTLNSLAVKPKIVITDSQAFGKVSCDTPNDILLTSFSILMARYKGSLSALIKGAAQMDKLRDGDTVLIAEGCTHHRQCEDIGTVKIPNWLNKYTGKKLNFKFSSGTEFPDLTGISLVIHCGGCMLNEKEMGSRVRHAQEGGVPMTNYGIAIAQMHGVLRRSLSPFKDMLDILDGKM
ncbi:MAG: [FeFe] hydrogenase H-cluster maturation GTPase HydF [Clostridiales bacterium]|nr:[FeFe] hydrogenase H-cluster maturation GTPase HydF [Clostridiales bacterium]